MTMTLIINLVLILIPIVYSFESLKQKANNYPNKGTK
jgi:hypothetical protein